MTTARSMIHSLGTEPPILADGRRAPDRREISLRWLSGTFLTGITSSILMGVALFAALDGRQQLAIPAEAAVLPNDHSDDTASRGKRLLGSNIVAMPTDRKIMEVSTVIHEGNKEVVRRKPFAHVKMNLAANHVAAEDYPPFDPLSIFSSSEAPPPPAARAGVIYGSNVESEVSLQTTAFPAKGNTFAFAPAMTLEEVEENVRSNGSVLTDGNTQLSALYYVDPQRFSSKDNNDLDITAGLAARIVEENISVSTPELVTKRSREYADDIIPVRKPETVAQAMTEVGYPESKAREISGYMQARSQSDLAPGDVLRIGVLQEGDMVLVVRASLYRRGKHQVTVSVDDHGKFIDGQEPPMLDAVASAFSDQPPQIMAGRELPDAYDGIYRAALSYGMSKEMTALLVKLLASNVDLQAQLKPTDRIEAFFSVADKKGQATKDSELLYVNAKFGDTTSRFYRFQNPDDNSVDYFDEDGKSIRQFLLRNPLPSGRMTSGFGMRSHPLLGYSRMHTGTDWAAPRGTPIIATGNGTVEKAGWDTGGYGNQTLIRHANGYVSSYNHQSAIVSSVREGTKVTQGQVIGYVGSSGESTGAHLHYELIVNGTKVDPMKVRLPGGSSLTGKALVQFEDERKRIDTLLNTQASNEVASR